MAKLNCVLFVTLLCGLSENAGITGGITPITDETELSTLAHRITPHLSKLGGQENTLELIKLHTATKQVVAGMRYEMLVEVNENKNKVNCTMTMWEKPWENFIKFDAECGGEKRKYKWSTENTGATEFPANQAIAFGGFGGFTDLTDEDIKNAHSKLKHSFTEINKKHNDFEFLLKSIVSGRKQVVNGEHYTMNILVENKEKETEPCQADMIETLNNLIRVEVTCQEKKYNIETTVSK